MKKKLLASVLALSLALGMCASAYAVDVTTAGETTVEVTSILNLPAIKVIINTPSNVIVNPYKLPYDDGTLDGEKSVISAPTAIQNDSAIKMSISATPSLQTNSDDLKILSSAPAAGSTEKALYLALNMAPVDNESAVDSYDGTGTGNVTIVVKKVGTTPLDTGAIELDAATYSGDTLTTSTYGALLFAGDCSGTTWADADKITKLSILFDITPVIGATT